FINFQEIVTEATKKGQESFSYKGCEIPLDEAESIIDAARKQFADQSLPISGDNEVLIIKENAELLDYEEDSSITDLEHRFEQIPGKTDFTLLKHQREGVAWLQSLYKEASPGCLLADDMGLGKTIQILYFFEWLAIKNEAPIVIVVAPLSLLENWEQEYSSFFPNGRYTIHQVHGSPDAFRSIFKQDVALRRPLLVLTNYESLRRYQFDVCAINWTACALDEAQRIKTPGTIVTNAAKALNSGYKIAMTGTPVENSYHDLWCIMDFCVPGLLGSAKGFSGEYAISKNDTPEDILGKGKRLRHKCGVYLKRRLKTEILDQLPLKYSSADTANESLFEKFQLSEQMPEPQYDEYVQVISSHDSSDKSENESHARMILGTIHRLKWLSDHPYLYDQNIFQWKPEDIVGMSARLIVLSRILKDIKKRKEKAVIFAEYKRTQLLLSHLIRIEYGFDASIINGDTPALQSKRAKAKASRQSIINAFNKSQGFNVIIMSPIAAGVGLNVTGANHVIHYGRHWNPAKEDQATDRVYRIGQEKDVFVYHPKAIASDFKTFDEVLSDLLDQKRIMAESTLFPSEMVEVKRSDLFSGLNLS
ncbi:MAG: DEAD/DEAH box helicase, partial [Spirochaetales bacterium]|nr:DEAD/DEAH box helicase [Spirochaetales bacterium]